MPFKTKPWAAVLLGTVALSACATPRKPEEPKFHVEGHRGARAMRPENTLAAFKYALEAGVDVLELDLLVTKDNQLVIGHDAVLNREICLAPGGKPIQKPVVVRATALKELQRHDCGSLVHPRFPTQVAQPGERMPSFDEFLAWLASDPNPHARVVRLNVEAKLDEKHPKLYPTPQLFAKLILKALRKHSVLDRTTLQSFDFRILRLLREIEPKIRTAALLEERPSRPLLEVANAVKVQVISLNERWLTQRDVLMLHKAGLQVVPWTANTPELWQRLADYGVDGIITDDPVGLMAFRKQWKRPRSSP